MGQVCFACSISFVLLESSNKHVLKINAYSVLIWCVIIIENSVNVKWNDIMNSEGLNEVSFEYPCCSSPQYFLSQILTDSLLNLNTGHTRLKFTLLCPLLRRCWRGILVSGWPCVRPCVRSSRFLMHAISDEPCMLEFWDFKIWIPHGKIADPYFFSCPSYLPFWSYAPLKKSEWNLVSKISGKLFELGAWNLVSG